MSVQRCPAAAVEAAVKAAIEAQDESYSVERWLDDANAAFPRIVLASLEGATDDTKTSRGSRVTAQVVVLSQTRGSITELVGIVDDILAAMTNTGAPFTVAGDWRVVDVDAPWVVETVVGDTVGVLHRATIRLSIWVEDVST